MSDASPIVTAAPALPEDRDAAHLIQWLRDRDVECPLCTYNLRGLTTPRCPECGQSFRLNVSLVEAYLKAWIALLASTASGAGIGIFFFYAVFRDGMPGRPDLWGDILVVDFMLMVPAAILAIVSRRRFLRLPRQTQWLLAGIVIFLVGGGFLTFFIMAGF